MDAVSSAACEDAVTGVEGGDNDKSGHGENDEGVDEKADHCDNALVVRLFNICHRVCVGSGAHTGFIGEQSALYALCYFGRGDTAR